MTGLTSVILPLTLKKLVFKLYDISLSSFNSSYKSLPSFYIINHSLSLAGGLKSSEYYK